MGQTPTDVFISEYVEGSGNNKAIEIYNPTNQPVNLTNYWLLRFSNGGSTFAEGGSVRLTGTLAPYKTFVIVNGQTTSTPTSPACSPVLQAMANQLDVVYPAVTYMNGNDAIALVKTPGGVPPTADMSNATPVDLIGQIGLGNAILAETGWSDVKDSTLTYTASGVQVTGKVINYIVQARATNGTSFGPFWMSWTSDHSLKRKSTVVKGVVINPIPFRVNLEWEKIPGPLDSLGRITYRDVWTNLGKHTCVADPTFGINESNASTWLNIYPNPVVSNRFTVSSKLPIKTVEVFNLIGQSVHLQSYVLDQAHVEISPLKLEKGVYIVKVTSSTNVTSAIKILIK